jgi:hypothetical protein
MSMDAHARFRTEAHSDVQPRFNERFLLSLASCTACLVLDDELNILPVSSHAAAITKLARPEGVSEGGPRGGESAELRELKESLKATKPVGDIVQAVKTVDQVKGARVGAGLSVGWRRGGDQDERRKDGGWFKIYPRAGGGLSGRGGCWGEQVSIGEM